MYCFELICYQENIYIYVYIYIYIYIGVGTYYLTDKNKLCGANPVDNLQNCKEAVGEIKKMIPNAVFKNTEVNANWPMGCYLWVNSDASKSQVYFNEHATGSENIEALHICKGHGKKNLIYSPRLLYFLSKFPRYKICKLHIVASFW